MALKLKILSLSDILQIETNHENPVVFCPALTKLSLDLHVKKSLSVCLSGLFFKASNWVIYWLLTVVLAPFLSD